MAAFASVRVGPFTVADVTYDRAVSLAADLAVEPTGVRRFYALHVGGLNARDQSDFVAEMNDAELVCADGGSIVLLAKLAGARVIERTPTTDAGWDVLRATGEKLGRTPRVALVGGPAEVVDKAAGTLREGVDCDIVMVEHGYHQEWGLVLEQLREIAPDVLILGLGAPKEMLWVREHYASLPPCLVVTCGGWFGFLSGEEARAPRVLRRSGLEWIARVFQAPTRLGPRYLRGLLSVVVVGFGTLVRRIPGRR